MQATIAQKPRLDRVVRWSLAIVAAVVLSAAGLAVYAGQAADATPAQSAPHGSSIGGLVP
jgi:hypothetical protein